MLEMICVLPVCLLHPILLSVVLWEGEGFCHIKVDLHTLTRILNNHSEFYYIRNVN